MKNNLGFADANPMKVRTLQIIAGALLAGVLFFAAFVLVSSRGEAPGAGEANVPAVTYAAIAFLALMAAVRAVLPNQLAKNQLRRIARGTWTPPPSQARMYPSPETIAAGFPTDAEKLFAVLQANGILGWALLEGPAFMGCVAYMVERNPLALAAVAVPVLAMVATFPTPSRVAGSLERMQGELETMRKTEVSGAGQ
jgi:hypothetical protein